MRKFVNLESRFILIVIISITLIVFDTYFHMFFQTKKYVSNFIDSFYYLYDKSYYILDFASKIIIGYNKVILENKMLSQELFLKKSELLLLEQYRQENARLYQLLNSPLCYNKKKIIATVLFVYSNAGKHQIIINKGIKNNIYVGQPVITDIGTVGQIISVNTYNSRILSICDTKHALSVQIQRNNARMILIGHGHNMELSAKCPMDFNISIGDMLITSGLDGRFPKGYPVATVSNIVKNKRQDSIIIYAVPIVNLKYLQDVLLIQN